MMREQKSVQSIIHLAQKYRLHDFKTIPLGTNQIELNTRIIHTKNTTKGKIITSETLFFVVPNSNLKDAEKWLLATAQMTSLYLSSDHDESSYEVNRPSQTLRPISNIINTSNEVHAVQIFKVHETQAMMYRLSGDTNRIHVEGSTFFNSTQPVLHGLCTLGYAVRAILKTYGGIFRYVDCSFTNPVFVGDTIAVHMWKGQNPYDISMTLIRFQVTRTDEKKNQHETVIKDGVIQLTMSTSKNEENHNNSKL
jgi:acyl dehydratase